MLPKQFRLTVVGYYTNPHKSVRRQSKRLTLFIKESSNKFPRFTFRIPKSIDKRSAIRHRMKRVMVECVRSALPHFSEAKDILIQPIRAWKKTDERSLITELNTLFITCGLLKQVETNQK